jgi:glucokinase
MSGKKIIAGDIGGSHVTLALFEANGTDLQLVHSIRAHVDSTQEKNEIFNDWLKVFEQLNFNLTSRELRWRCRHLLIMEMEFV